MDWEKKKQTKTQTHRYNNNSFQCFLGNRDWENTNAGGFPDSLVSVKDADVSHPIEQRLEWE